MRGLSRDPISVRYQAETGGLNSIAIFVEIIVVSEVSKRPTSALVVQRSFKGCGGCDQLAESEL